MYNANEFLRSHEFLGICLDNISPSSNIVFSEGVPGLGQGQGYDDFELCIRDFEVRVSSEINSKEVLSQLDKVFRDVVSVDSL